MVKPKLCGLKPNLEELYSIWQFEIKKQCKKMQNYISIKLCMYGEERTI